MKIARVLYPVKTLGPGNRLGIWVFGCNRGCKGCANPELWEAPVNCEVSLELLSNQLSTILVTNFMATETSLHSPIDGVTISGGEPFNQPEELEKFIDYFKEFTDDILIFTGYKRKELAQYEDRIISKIAVLVDGEYLEDRNDGHPLRGSNNQTIHYVNQAYRTVYESYIEENKGKNRTQLFSVQGGQVAVGIHQKDFNKRHHDEAAVRGLGLRD